MITGYQVVYGDTIAELNNEVMEWVGNGFEPIGGVAVCMQQRIDQSKRWYQAMVKRDVPGQKLIGNLTSTIKAAADPKTALVQPRADALARRQAEIAREATVVRDANGSFKGYSNHVNGDNDLTEASLKKALKQIKQMQRRGVQIVQRGTRET